jgi:anti-sigma factor RsiW
MNCHEIENLLSACVDKQLSPEEAKAVEDHVASCRSCSETLMGLRKLVGLLGRLPSAACPTVLACRLQEAAVTALRGETVLAAGPAVPGKAGRRWPDFFLRYKHFIQVAAAAAAVALIALANVFIFAPPRRREPAAETAFSPKDHSATAQPSEKSGRAPEAEKSLRTLKENEKKAAETKLAAKYGSAERQEKLDKSPGSVAPPESKMPPSEPVAKPQKERPAEKPYTDRKSVV